MTNFKKDLWVKITDHPEDEHNGKSGIIAEDPQYDPSTNQTSYVVHLPYENITLEDVQENWLTIL